MKKIMRTIFSMFGLYLFTASFVTGQTTAGPTALGGCSTVKITSQHFNKKLISRAYIIDEISECEKVVAVDQWAHAKIWLQAKNAAGVFVDVAGPIESRMSVPASSPTTYGEVTWDGLSHGTYRGRVQVPVAYIVPECGEVIYHSMTSLNIGLQSVMSANFFSNEAVAGPTVAADIAYNFEDGEDVNNLFDFGEPVIMNASASKNYDLYWLAIFENNGPMRYWSQGWTTGSTLGVANLSSLWGSGAWNFESLRSYTVQFAIENSQCINSSWNNLDQSFFICPSGSGCRYADTGSGVLKLSPNPAAGMFRITGLDVSGYPDHRLVLSDLTGRQVKNVRLADGGEVDVSDLPNGLYVATLWDNQIRLLSDKLVVNH